MMPKIQATPPILPVMTKTVAVVDNPISCQNKFGSLLQNNFIFLASMAQRLSIYAFPCQFSESMTPEMEVYF